MLVSIIIPVFGDVKYLNACVNALAVDGEDIERELILVDNGTRHPLPDNAVVIRNEQNEGYARANNQASMIAKGSLLVLLNVDAEAQPGWLSPLVAEFSDPEVVMAGPRIEHFDGSLQTSGIRTWHGNGSAGGEERKDEHPTEDVDGVTGACMVIRKSIYREFGGLDESFRNGYEDVSMCLSVREAGWRIRYVASSLVRHHESVSGEERWKYAAQNVSRMNELWGNR